MNKHHLQTLIQNITVWKRGAQRAPHKPLLLLYALARSLCSRVAHPLKGLSNKNTLHHQKK